MKLSFTHLIIITITLSLVLNIASASRLPVVDGDEDNWGTILNDYLSRIGGDNATELNQIMVNGSTNIYDNSVGGGQIEDASITSDKIGTDQVKDDEIDYNAVTLADFSNDANYLDKDDGGIITGGLIIEGDLSVIGDYIYANVTNQYLNGSFLPSISDLFDLGSIESRWKDIFVNNINTDAFTAGSILFSNGSRISEDNTNLYWNDTSKRLGIGTNAPDQALDVRGITTIRVDSNDQFKIDRTDNADISSVWSFHVGSTLDPLSIRRNGAGTEVITFTDQSRVGIGTTSPNSLLDIQKTGAATGSVNAGTSLLLDSSDSTNYIQFRSPTSGSGGILWGDAGSNARGQLTYNHNADKMEINAAGVSTLSMGGTEATFNEGGADIDFRVEGDTLNHAFYLDANASNENIALLASSAPNWQSMDGGIFIANATTVPTGNPTGGGFLYVEDGELKYRDTSGTITTVAPDSGGTGNSTFNQTYHDTSLDVAENRTAWFSTYNATYDSHVEGNSTFNQTLTDTLYAPEGTGNSTFNQTLTDSLYYGGSDLTAGSILFSNGSQISENNSNLFWNNTEGRLGIGTNAPAAKLEVKGDVYLATEGTGETIRIAGTDHNAFFNYGGDEDVYLRPGKITGEVIMDKGSIRTEVPVVFNEGGADADFRVEGDTEENLIFVNASTDRVGIGTNTPTVKLEVEDSSSSILINLKGTATGAKITLRDSTNNLHGYLGSMEGLSTNAVADSIGLFSGNAIHLANTASLRAINIQGDDVVINEDGGDADFRVEGDNDTHLLFCNAGDDRVGIGTNSPSTKLHVDGTGAFNEGIQIERENAPGNRHTISSPTGNLIVDISGSANSFVVETVNGATERFKVGGTGELVINEPGGDYNFRVEGDTEENLIFVNASTDRVGIGTNSPSRKLHIEGGDIQITDQTPTIEMKDSDDNSIVYINQLSGVMGITDGSGNGIFYNSTTDNVGIGTNAPVSDFVVSDAGGTGLEINAENSNNRVRLIAYDRTGAAYKHLRIDSDTFEMLSGGAYDRFSIDAGESVLNDVGGDYDFRVEGDTEENLIFVNASTDRVGIGTNSPSYPLDVVGDIRSSSGVIASGGSVTLGSAGGIFGLYGSGGLSLTYWNGSDVQEALKWSTANLVVNEGGNDYNFRVEGNTSENLLFCDASTDRAGIGLNTPQTTLHIHDSGTGSGDHARLLMTTGDTGSAYNDGLQIGVDADLWARILARSGGGISNLMIGTEGNQIVYLYTNNTERIEMQGDGDIIINDIGANADFRVEGDTEENLFFVDASTNRVGIGTSVPKNKLNVVGDANITGNLYAGGAQGISESIYFNESCTLVFTNGLLTSGCA